MREKLRRFPASTVFVIATLACAVGFAGACAHRVVNRDKALPGDYSVFLLTYELSACPPPGRGLPARGKTQPPEPEASFEAGYFDGRYCHGFTKYALRVKERLSTRDTVPFYVAVGYKKSCTVRVGVPVDRLCTGRALSECVSYKSADLQSRRLLGLLLGDLGLKAAAQPKNAEGFTDNRSFHEWCEKRIHDNTQSLSHPIFRETVPAPELAPNVQ